MPNPAANRRLVLIETARLHPDPSNRPDGSGEAELACLAQTIRLLGVLQPVLATPIETRPGHFRISDGHRRWRAA